MVPWKPALGRITEDNLEQYLDAAKLNMSISVQKSNDMLGTPQRRQGSPSIN